jgi:hypothetical protein
MAMKKHNREVFLALPSGNHTDPRRITGDPKQCNYLINCVDTRKDVRYWLYLEVLLSKSIHHLMGDDPYIGTLLPLYNCRVGPCHIVFIETKQISLGGVVLGHVDVRAISSNERHNQSVLGFNFGGLKVKV